MGESTCFMQPFSYTSGFPNESREENPINALGQSISFGRFMSESLAWEKWSTFSHNRYVEEAERFSQPGSVAQKKAFFEAHYKKIAAQKAAALLEQQNSASNNVNEVSKPKVERDVENVGSNDSQTTVSNPNEIPEPNIKGENENNSTVDSNPNDEHELWVSNTDLGSTIRADGFNLDAQKVNGDGKEMEKAEQVVEHQVFVESPAKNELLSSQHHVDVRKDNEAKEMEFGRTPQIERPLLKSSNYNQEGPGLKNKKKAALSSSNLSMFHRASRIPSSPAKSSAKICNENATPTQTIKKSTVDSADRKRATPKSLGMQVNFTPIREFNKLTATVIRKIERSRVGATSSKVSKDCSTPLTTPKTASKKDVQNKHSSATTPWSEKRRNKTQSPFSFTPFSLRTEERAARRKEKLEEKFNANESQRVQIQTTLKEKAETEIRRLRQTLCFKARPLPDFYKGRKVLKNETKKVPLSPNQGRKLKPNSCTGEGKNSLRDQRSSSKISGCKNVQGKTHSLTLRSLMMANENTSPNIQY